MCPSKSILKASQTILTFCTLTIIATTTAMLLPALLQPHTTTPPPPHVKLHTCPVTAPCSLCLPKLHASSAPSYKYPRNKSRAITKPTEMEEKMKTYHNETAKLRCEFLEVLRSRQSPEVALRVEKTTPVKHPLFQEASPPKFSKAMAACPKEEIDEDRLKEENLYLFTEAEEQGRVPVLILSLKEKGKEEGVEKRPAVVFLHSTHKNKEWLRPLLEAYASRGYVATAIDSRYHGERATNKTTYRDALISAWKKGDTMPFIFDTVRDLIKLADYLTTRQDIDPLRIGIIGESLGGMHAWFGAFADTRYAVVVPIIGVQGFRWAIDNNMWQGRVDSIRPLFEEARIDLGKSEIDKEVVEKVWNRIAPGLDSIFDSPHTVPAIAPRPLLILTGAEDPRCPLGGLEVPKSKACEAYGETNSLDQFKLIAQQGVEHQMTPWMVIEASNWFDKFFKPRVLK